MSPWFQLLPEVSAEGLSCLWRATWQGSLGVLAVGLICGLVPRMPARFQCWLWRLALLKFGVVLLCRVPLALPLLPAAAEPPAQLTMPPVTLSTASIPHPAQTASGQGGTQTAGGTFSLLTVLFLVWLVVVAWQAFRLIRGWWTLRRFRRHCRTVVCAELTRQLRPLCQAYAVRRPPTLLEDDSTGSPMLLGLLRPAIVMPSRSAFAPSQYRMALAHELAHVKRHDLAWNLVAALVRAAFVFNPLVWWASWRLDVSQEIAADQFVLTGFGKELCTYAEMLLTVASQPQTNRLGSVLSVGTVGRYRTLTRRIAAMKSFHPTSRSVVALSFILILLGATIGIVPWRLVAAEAPAASPQASTSTAKSVTVFPIVLNSGAPIPGVSSDMSKNMAEMVGLLLERGGMKEIEIAETPFLPPPGTDLAKTAEAFGRSVQSQKLQTDYAFFGQFLGTPGKGVDEIRLAVVDRQGKVVLADRLDRQQLLARGAKKVDPLLACAYAVNQVRGLWGLADPDRQNAPEGKMAKLWAEKSAMPSKAEREAIQTRLKKLKETIKSSTVAVLVQVSGNNDAKAADALAAMLTREGLGRAHAAEQGLNFQPKPSTNQLRLLWKAARALQDALHKTPPSADYVLLAEYGVGHLPGGKTAVDGVEIIVCNRAGEWVLLDLQNDEHREFQQVNPQSPDDCNRLVIEVLKNLLR